MNKGFELIRVIKASTSPTYRGDAPLTHVYKIEVHDINGNHIKCQTISLSAFRATYGSSLGMTKCHYGILRNGRVTTLMQEEYNDLAKEWSR
jgi:hypothetical protein